MTGVQTCALPISRRKTYTVSFIASAAGDTVTLPLTSTLISDQTSSSSIALAVNIAAAYTNVGSGSVTVARNSVNVLFASGWSFYPMAGEKLPAISQNNTSPITVTFTTPGQVVLELHKVAGTVDPNFNVGDYK